MIPDYYRVISTPKHFAVHSGPEPTRHFTDVDVSKHDEEDTYLPAFRAAVVEGKAGSVDVRLQRDQWRARLRQSIPAATNSTRRLGLPGICGLRLRRRAQHLQRPPRHRPTQPQASAISVIRGMDNECIDFAKVSDDHDYRPYIEAVQQGYLPESSIDTALIRSLHRPHSSRHVLIRRRPCRT